MITINNVLKCFRLAHENLTITELAKAVGLSEQYISNTETSRKPSQALLNKLATFYDVHAEDFNKIVERANKEKFDYPRLMLEVVLLCQRTKHIGGVLKCFRLSYGDGDLTISKLSEMVGVTQGHISRIENGEKKPSDMILNKLSEIYNVPKEEFFRILEFSKKNDLKFKELLLEVVKTCLKYEQKI